MLGTWVLLESSSIDKIRYDEEKRILEVVFKKGSIYQYTGVPIFIFESFVKAESPGNFLNTHIKDHYRFKRLN